MLFNPNRSPTTYLVDAAGQVVHTWQHDLEPGGGAYLLENGHLLRGAREPDVPVFSGGGQSGRLQEITWDGEVVWDFRFANEDHLLHHDMAVMPWEIVVQYRASAPPGRGRRLSWLREYSFSWSSL